MVEQDLVCRHYELGQLSEKNLYAQVLGDFPDVPLCPRSKFRLVSEYVTWLLNGTKHTTVRYRPEGIDVPTSLELPLFETEIDLSTGSSASHASPSLGFVRITHFVVKSFSLLDQDDASQDGFRDATQLRRALQNLYSPIYGHCIRERDLVSVYSICIVEDQRKFQD